jgi:hypothetical protein
MKSLDIDHAREGKVMLAYQMNGEQLPLLNGSPLRLIVPEWYSTYWVKMLNDIEVLDAPDDNYWMKTAYRRFAAGERPAGGDGACSLAGRSRAHADELQGAGCGRRCSRDCRLFGGYQGGEVIGIVAILILPLALPVRPGVGRISAADYLEPEECAALIRPTVRPSTVWFRCRTVATRRRPDRGYHRLAHGRASIAQAPRQQPHDNKREPASDVVRHRVRNCAAVLRRSRISWRLARV